MAKIHMETEQARNLARILDQKNNELLSEAENIKREARRLSYAWYGSQKSRRLISDMNNWSRNCEIKAQEIQILSRRLDREIDQWMQVDSDFGDIYMQLHSLGFGPYRLDWGHKDEIEGFGYSDSITTPMIGESELGWDGDTKIKTLGDDDWSKGETKLGFGVKVPLIDDELYDMEDYYIRESVVGIEKTTKFDFNVGDYGAGFKGTVDEEGASYGFFGEWDSFKASADSTIGSAVFGFTTGVAITGLSAEGFLGLKDNDFGGSIGGSLVGIELSKGINIAGYNIGISAGAAYGVEFGFKVGDDTELKVGPFKLGLHFGKAEI